MKSTSISAYIVFGMQFRFLRDAKEGIPIKRRNFIFGNINRVLDGLDKFGLPVTARASSDLKVFQSKMEKKGKDDILTTKEAEELCDIMSILDRTLCAEAAGNIAFIVTDKRIDINKLISDVPSLLAPNIYDQLPGLAKYDLKEACKCIAFERPTAAAFHLMRCTEELLRHLYRSYVKRKRIPNLLWGPMIESMKERSNKPPKELLDNLDNIRVNYRNPTGHPDKTYDIQEVQDLFGLCVDVINKMVPLIK